ncbi:MAG: hypothetical protein M3273_06415, partial [Actinomycetota bacterium]|nr:hypothetical protein [Actinomycetota bacterium]
MTTMLVVVADDDPWIDQRVWGTGGWDPPEQREGFDWLTLGRFLGWSADLVRVSELGPGVSASVVVVATPLETLPRAALEEVVVRAERGALVVFRGSPADGESHHVFGGMRDRGLSSGTSLAWTGPGARAAWPAGNGLDHRALEAERPWEVWGEIGGHAAVFRRPFGDGSVVVLGLHPSAVRDRCRGATSFLVTLLTHGASAPVAWFDLSGVVALRMDDPGGAQNVYCKEWSYAKLASSTWAGLGDELARREARMTIAYTVGWIDDGDARRGTLYVDGRPEPRRPGAIHASPRVRYVDERGHVPGTVHDYRDEYAGIRALVDRGLAGVELHGYTHVHPDAQAWLSAPDRGDVSWFREFGPVAQTWIERLDPRSHPLSLARAGVE